MIGFDSTNQELQIHVESTQGNILRAAESVWGGMKQALREQNPELTSIRLIDGVTNREVMVGRTGARVEFARREVLTPIVIALLTTVYVVIGCFTFAADEPWKLIGSAIPAGVAAISFGIVALRDSKKGALRWE